jgi:hypothetical protein
MRFSELRGVRVCSTRVALRQRLVTSCENCRKTAPVLVPVLVLVLLVQYPFDFSEKCPNSYTSCSTSFLSDTVDTGIEVS